MGNFLSVISLARDISCDGCAPRIMPVTAASGQWRFLSY